MTALRYTGDDEGTPYVMGVPARDLSDDDLDQLKGGTLGKDAESVAKNLIATGIFAESKPAAPKAAKSKADKEK